MSCPDNLFDENLRMFFGRRIKHWAIDSDSSTKLGDIVLIRKRPEEQLPTSIVEYAIEKIVFQHGNLIDPVTKRRIYRDKYEMETSLEKSIVHEVVDKAQVVIISEFLYFLSRVG